MDVPSDGLTADSTMVGTLRYAAPERLAGGEVTPRSDVWALGAVLYEMLTGVPAVAATDPVGALAASQAAPATFDGPAAVPGLGRRPGDGDGPGRSISRRRGAARCVGRRRRAGRSGRDDRGRPDRGSGDGRRGPRMPVVSRRVRLHVAPRSRPRRRSLPQVAPLPPPGPADAPSRRRGSLRPGILTAGLVLAAAVLFALAGTSLLAGGQNDGTGANGFDAAASTQPTAAQPAPSVKPAATQATPKPKPGKGKGKGKGNGQD